MMPTALRPKGKATTIAYKILGTPPNQYNKQNARDKKIEQQLRYHETSRVR